MGKSSTGKDTIYRRLLDESSIDLKTIIPYTTRPIREGEVDGREYFFIDDEKVKDLQKEGRIIELRAYNTYHGVWKYMTVDDGQLDLTNHDYLIIGTLEAYVNTKKYFNEDCIIPLYVEVDDGTRLSRALNREKTQANPKYQELCRRFLADCEDFSEEKLLAAGVNKRFVNLDLDICIHEIKEYIRQNRQ